MRWSFLINIPLSSRVARRTSLRSFRILYDPSCLSSHCMTNTSKTIHGQPPLLPTHVIRSGYATRFSIGSCIFFESSLLTSSFGHRFYHRANFTFPYMQTFLTNSRNVNRCQKNCSRASPRFLQDPLIIHKMNSCWRTKGYSFVRESNYAVSKIPQRP